MRPSISTAGGDKGKTGLFGGRRLSKASVRLHAYGTVDEMNAVIGLILTENLPDVLREHLGQIQKDLFVLGADLSTPLEHTADSVIRITKEDVTRLEQWGNALESGLPMLQKFILPSGCKAAAMLHQVRTICRRGERWLVHLAEEEQLSSHAMVYINRLSDYFFLAARTANIAANTPETEWTATQEQAKNS